MKFKTILFSLTLLFANVSASDNYTNWNSANTTISSALVVPSDFHTSSTLINMQNLHGISSFALEAGPTIAFWLLVFGRQEAAKTVFELTQSIVCLDACLFVSATKELSDKCIQSCTDAISKWFLSKV